MAVRRRGSALDDAILNAAWAELNDLGYSGLTLESVANRAGTSRTVISRRWSNRNSLMVAAFARYLEQNPIHVPDLGSVREEVMVLLRQLSERAQPAVIRLMLDMMETLIDEGSTMAVVKAQIGDSRSLMSEILERGIARGEVDPARLTPRVVSVAADLARHEFMMTFAPLSDKAILEIVDDIFLPLIRSVH